jgi:hypothetical protein
MMTKSMSMTKAKSTTNSGWVAKCINETCGARKSRSKAGVDWVAELINEDASVGRTKTTETRA